MASDDDPSQANVASLGRLQPPSPLCRTSTLHPRRSGLVRRSRGDCVSLLFIERSGVCASVPFCGFDKQNLATSGLRPTGGPAENESLLSEKCGDSCEAGKPPPASFTQRATPAPRFKGFSPSRQKFPPSPNPTREIEAGPRYAKCESKLGQMSCGEIRPCLTRRVHNPQRMFALGSAHFGPRLRKVLRMQKQARARLPDG